MKEIFERVLLRCKNQFFSNIPDTNLIECLTKINRMDIVHLMETITEPLQERISHSYAEIEQTITLDHSEGQTICVCMSVCYVWLIQATGPTIFPFLEGGLWPLVRHSSPMTLSLPCPFWAPPYCSFFVISSWSQSGWAAIKKHPELCGLNNRNLFLTLLETGSQRSR